VGLYETFILWIDRDLVAADQDESITVYVEELREQATFGTRLPGASLEEVKSPDGRYSVYTKSRLHRYHTYLRDENTGEVTPLVSVREPDPWSGPAHAHGWSRDSGAVFFSGEGYVPEYGYGMFPLIYVIESDTLFYLAWRP